MSAKPRHHDALAFVIAYAVDVIATARRAGSPNQHGLSAHSEQWGAEAEADLEHFCSRLGNALTRLSVAGLTRTHAGTDELARIGVLADARRILLAPRHNLREAGRLPRVALTEREAAPTFREVMSEHNNAATSSRKIREIGVELARQTAMSIRHELGVDPSVLRSDEIDPRIFASSRSLRSFTGPA